MPAAPDVEGVPGSQCPDGALFGFPLFGASGTQIGAMPAVPGVGGVPGSQCPDWELFGFPDAVKKFQICNND